MFGLFRKKQEEISRITPGFEETERKTPKTGIILLIIMFVAGTFFGWRALDDLARLPTPPAALSSCSFRYRDAYLSDALVRPYDSPSLYREYNYGYNNSLDCNFSQLEKDHNIPALYEPRKPLQSSLDDVYKQLSSTQNSLSDIRYQIQRGTTEYGTGLEEKQTQIKAPLFPIDSTGQSLILLRQQEQNLLNQITKLEANRDSLNAQIKIIDDRLKEAYKPVFKAQNRLLRWYEFKVFLLQLIFTLPFFYLVFRGYLRLHRKNSPYAIIFTAMVGVAAILLLRVILFWLWGLFLARVLEVIIEWFGHYGLFRTILFYLGMVLSFVIFGGAVWWLQKRIFDPRRVTIRRFRAKQCPHCQTNLDLAAYYCPNCGNQIKAKCEKCGQARFVGLPNCPYCGAKHEA
ncbi:zinc ribbon domain-containing protein [Candidatus Wolfebacteria bacterium]|nr:zinc ribbon domain-containing protein [Candidatus Wolfebacteria bacterium]